MTRPPDDAADSAGGSAADSVADSAGHSAGNSGGNGSRTAPDGVPGQLRAAVAIVGLEGLALAVAAVVLLVKTAAGHPGDVAAALLLAGLCALGALTLGLAGRGLLGLRPAARTPIVVLQLLALPVGYSLAFQAHLPGYGAPILLAAVAVLYLLFTPPARAALDRPPR